MTKLAITPEEFDRLIPAICAADTSADPSGWSEINPTWGHCAVVALLAQDIFGGELLRGSLSGTPFAAMTSHYWNRLEGGQEADFTAAQFGGRRPPLVGRERERSYMMEHPATVHRYELLLRRFMRLA